MNYDSELLVWAFENLDITHDRLPEDKITIWQLLARDEKNFMAHALFGFYWNRIRKGTMSLDEISDAERVEYLYEFKVKLALAADRQVLSLALPLFEIYGMEKLNRLQLVNDETLCALQIFRKIGEMGGNPNG